MSKQQPSSKVSAIAQELYERYLLHSEGDESMPFESFLDEHLEHAADLQRLHARWQQLAGMVDALGDDMGSDTGAKLRLVGDEDVENPTAPEAVDKLIARLESRPKAGARYATRGELGRGGMGVVLRTWDGDLRRQLAMKVMLPVDPKKGSDPASSARRLGRFLEEAQITGQLDHPGIVPVHELGLDETGRVFFTMRLVRGRSLRTIFELVHDQREGWTVARTLGVLQKVCEALAYAHSKGVLHRDLKPANIMVGRFGEVYVMDWGLAKVLDRDAGGPAAARTDHDPATLDDVQTERHDLSSGRNDSPLRTLDGAVVGTPAYMSPEQARGQLDELGPPSDVYAVGALLYHLLAGEMPFVPKNERRGPREVLRALREGSPRPLHQINRQVDLELAAICDKAMAREPQERYADMGAMADELRAFLEGRVVRAHRTGALVELRKWIVRNKLSAAILLLFLIAMIALGLRERQRNEHLLAATRNAQREQADAERARVDAETAKQLAEAETGRADAALQSAESATIQALQQGYVASLAAAQAALADSSRAELVRQLAGTPVELRGWEWQHLMARSDVSLGVIARHTSAVSGLSVSPDGKQMLSASWGAELELWDAQTGERLSRLDPGETTPTDVLFTANGQRLAIAGSDGQLRILDTNSGRLLNTLAPPEGNSQRAPSLTQLTYSARNNLLIAGREDGRLLAWHLNTTTPLSLPRPHAQAITDLALAPDGALLLSASHDRSVALLDVLTGELLDTLYDHDSSVLAVTHSPVADRFASAQESGVVRIYNVGSQLPELEFDVAPESPTQLLFTPNGSQLVAGMTSGNLRVWDAWTGRELGRLMGHRSGVSALSSTPDGLRILSGALDGELRAWDLTWGAAHTRLQGHTDSVRSLATARTGSKLLSAAWDGRTRLWDTGALISLGVGDLPGAGGAAVAFSANGTLAAAGLNNVSRHQDFPLVIWQVSASGELSEHRRLLGHQQPIRAVAFDTAGQRLASASDDRSVRVWNVERGTLLQTLEGHGSWVRDVAFHPIRPWLASASFDESVRLWSLDDGSELAALHDHTRGVLSVAFSPNGRWLASAGEDQQVLLYDTKDGLQLVARLQGHRSAVQDLAFHPSGNRLASVSSDGAVRLWSLPEGHALLSLNAGEPATAVAFSGDGAQLHVAAGNSILSWETGSSADGFTPRHARDAALEPARRRFTDLLEALEDPFKVADALRADERLDPAVRDEALRLVRNFGTDPERLTEAARGLLLERHADPETYREARRLARAAKHLAPGNPRVLHVLGLAQFRCGDDRSALESLGEARRLNASLREYPQEWNLLVLAMANARLGATALAQAYLDDALLSLETHAEAPGPATSNLAREARQLVKGER